jgi:hypothetical protein
MVFYCLVLWEFSERTTATATATATAVAIAVAVAVAANTTKAAFNNPPSSPTNVVAVAVAVAAVGCTYARPRKDGNGVLNRSSKQ